MIRAGSSQKQPLSLYVSTVAVSEGKFRCEGNLQGICRLQPIGWLVGCRVQSTTSRGFTFSVERSPLLGIILVENMFTMHSEGSGQRNHSLANTVESALPHKHGDGDVDGDCDGGHDVDCNDDGRWWW